MALEIGSYISCELVEYIDQWTDSTDINDLARKHDLSNELARKLSKGERKITPNNLKLITDIVAMAIKNRNSKFIGLQKTHNSIIKHV